MALGTGKRFMPHSADTLKIAPDSQSPAPVDRAGALIRLLAIATVLVVAVLTVHLTPIRAWLADAQRVRETLAALGTWVYPVSIVGIAILVACGIPRLIFCVLSGMVFGFAWGLLIGEVGTLLGQYAVFLFIRWGGREWVLSRWPKVRKLAELMHAQGIVGVILARQLPVHSMLINVCLGLSHVKHRHYLIGTAIGLFPEAIPATLAGAGLVKTSLAHSASYLALATAVFAGIWIGCWYALRRLRGSVMRSDTFAFPESLKQVQA